MGRSDDVRCRCWQTTTAELHQYLGSACGRLEVGQLRRFVQAWHDVWHSTDEICGPDGCPEAAAALAATVEQLLAEADDRDGARRPGARTPADRPAYPSAV